MIAPQLDRRSFLRVSAAATSGLLISIYADPLDNLFAQTPAPYQNFVATAFVHVSPDNLYTFSANTTTQSAYIGCSQESGLSTTANPKNQLAFLSYDAAGNVTSNPGIASYTYNAENQLVSTAGVTYTYDGDGKRVMKSNGTIYWYGLNNDPLMETSLSNNMTAAYYFLNRQRVARQLPSNEFGFYFTDHLGNSRYFQSLAGGNISDFYPFGGERSYTNTCPQNYKFEGKERDTETGNDDFGARYYSNRFGRWLSADWSNVPVAVPYANLANPQTLNLYSMVADDPESFADLDGHSFWTLVNGAGCDVGHTEWCTYDPTFSVQAKEATPTPPQDQSQDNDKKQSGYDDKDKSTSGAGGGQSGSGGGGRKGERKWTRRPENPRKHVRPNPNKPGQWQVKNPHTGKWIDKPPGWSPNQLTQFEIAQQQVAAQSMVKVW